jgi:hypothetical protein
MVILTTVSREYQDKAETSASSNLSVHRTTKPSLAKDMGVRPQLGNVASGHHASKKNTQDLQPEAITPSPQDLKNTPVKVVPFEEITEHQAQNARRGHGGYAHHDRVHGRENEAPAEVTKGKAKPGNEVKPGESSCFTPTEFYGISNGNQTRYQ